MKNNSVSVKDTYRAPECVIIEVVSDGVLCQSTEYTYGSNGFADFGNETDYEW